MARWSEARGRLVARLLAGAWRDAPPAPDLTPDDLSVVAPLLLRSGCGALGWWKVRGSALESTEAAQGLRQAYRLHTLRAAVHEREIGQTVALLQAAGIEPILAKGWLAAQLYPHPGLRPYGDIDLCVDPRQRAAAVRALSATDERGPVDFHAPADLEDRTHPQLEAQARTACIGGAWVRTLGPEDHFRLLALHFLRHGGWRPLWLCDVGAALERLPAAFDWDQCLCGNPRRTQWLLAVVRLAHDLLGASLDHLPAAHRPGSLPGWVGSAVLRQWGSAWPHREPGPLLALLRGPTPQRLAEEARSRWPDPLSARVCWRAALNGWPRLPFQLATVLALAAWAPVSRLPWVAARLRDAY